jgi:hypothetical protein
VTYMSDKLGLHRISNPDKDGFAVSLHCELSFAGWWILLTPLSIYASKCCSLWLQCL